MRNLLTELLPSIKGKYHLFADSDDEFKVRPWLIFTLHAVISSTNQQPGHNNKQRITSLPISCFV